MQWNKKHIGKIRYCKYWRKYALIVDVDGIWVTELDTFDTVGNKTRTHCTPIDKGDKIMTVKEFYREIMKLEKTS